MPVASVVSFLLNGWGATPTPPSGNVPGRIVALQEATPRLEVHYGTAAGVQWATASVAGWPAVCATAASHPQQASGTATGTPTLAGAARAGSHRHHGTADGSLTVAGRARYGIAFHTAMPDPAVAARRARDEELLLVLVD